MPELPDVVLYVESLDRLLKDQVVKNIRVRSPSVLQTYDPMIDEMVGRRITGFSRRGKRIVWEFEPTMFFVVHPMIAGRFHWKRSGYAAKSKRDLLAVDLDEGTMVLTEASTQKRARAWLLRSKQDVDRLDAGGINVLECNATEFDRALRKENRTLKRALTNPKTFDGIGNAYSDEILLAARLSPLRRTDQLSDAESKRLYEATQTTLRWWIEHLRESNGDRFPEKVTAFRPEMKAHGKFGEPCRDCGAPIQRIRYASNECNYCPGCQTEGRILSDRSLARLLKDDWPKTLDDLED